MLKVGDSAPTFTFRQPHGEEVNTSTLLGKRYVVFFYPRDDTPGCTKEACGFRDTFAAFSEKDVPIIGVSVDPEESHAKFRKKYQLPFALRSDTDKSVVNAFGVWGPKKFMGKEFEGIHRTTFIIDQAGKIAYVDGKVKPEAHAEQILTTIDTIN